MNLRAPLWAVIGGVVALGWLAIEVRAQFRRVAPCEGRVWCSAAPPPVNYQALRPLPRWHRLRSEDFGAPPLSPTLAAHLPPRERLIGRYVNADVPAHAPLKADLLLDRPWPSAASGRTLLRLPAFGNQQLIQQLAVRWSVELCADKVCPVTAASVVAIDCVDASDTRCVVVVEVDEQGRTAYDAFTPKKSLTIHAVGAPR